MPRFEDAEVLAPNIVVLLDRRGIGGWSQPNLEAELGASIETAPIQALPAGAGMMVRVPRHGMEGIVTENRLQVRLLTGEVTEKAVNFMARFTHTLFRGYHDCRPKGLGNNFTLVFDAPEGQKAIKFIADHALAPAFREGRLTLPLLGGAAWLYFQAGQKVLWFRLEPRNTDRDSTRILADANFHADLTNGQLPNETELASGFLDDFSTLKNVFVHLWT
ncbi:MAG: hypothetical protein HY683_02935 [Chloroflexi bacterium]|nr:hypothetical protein [Chloroflexota bacterium]